MSSGKADFKAALLDEDRELRELDMSPSVEARLKARLEASLYRRRTGWRYPVVALASCAAGIALAFAVLRPAHAPVMLAGMKVQTSSPSFDAVSEGSDVVVRSGEATLQADGATVRMTRPGRLRSEARGMRVVSGRVELDVQKRTGGQAPLRVLVSDGEIEVRGTRFSVDQLEGGGGAALLWEGSIVFRAPDGREVVLRPGQSVAWPLPPLVAAPPPPVPESPKADDSFVDEPKDEVLPPLPPQAVRPPDAGADWSAHDRLLRAHTLLERIPRLREAGAHAQAATELEAAMKQDLPAAARERLSSELIDIYSGDLWDTVKGCRQVKEHRWRYPAGRYDAEVEKARRELSCPK